MASTGDPRRALLALVALVAAALPVGLAVAEPPLLDTALAPSETWESGVASEPDLWWDGGRWNMVYTAGWEHSSLAWATAERARGPWVKRGPILGNGVGGWDGPASHHSVYREGGRFYIYFPSDIDGNAGVLRVAVGRSLRNLHVLPDPVLVPPVESGATGPANTSVIKDGDTYRMLFDAKVNRASWWEMGYATAPSPAGPFTVQAFPLPTLQHHPDSMYGGADLRKTRGGYAIWYHAARDGNTTLPTDVYRATSSDLANWTATSDPVLVHPDGYDQYADPVQVRHGARVWLFMSLMNNPAPSGRVVATRLR